MQKTKWTVCARQADFKRIADTFGIDQVTARIIRNREVVGDEQIRLFLHGGPEDLHDPSLMRDAGAAAGILREKIRGKKKIRVIGDYDIDGVCATAILTEVLASLGADVDHEIPDRIQDGYGLRERMITDALRDGVDTILTCDNGISAIREIDLAKEEGLTVIVTDHHQPGETLPRADAVVDPCREDDGYPFPGICGAVVAWKVMQLLTGRDLREYLDLAAFATVGDVMRLQDENRIIVRHGLQSLEKTRRAGLRALMAENGLGGKPLHAWQIGFILGPCINAGGRLDTAALSLRLLLTKDPEEAAALAKELVSLNQKRRTLTDEGLARAAAMLEGPQDSSAGELLSSGPEGMRTQGRREKEGPAAAGRAERPPEALTTLEDRVLVVYLPACHESIAGIIAGKLKERYYRPAIVLTDAGEEGLVKGSGRSIEGYHMFRELSGCADLLENFGGHPMAAGLTLRRENLGRLAERLNRQCGLTEDELTQVRRIDVPVPMYYLREKLVEELDVLEPYGTGNERPLFALRGVTLTAGRIRGAAGGTFTCVAADGTGTRLECIWFGDTKDLVRYFFDIWGVEKTRKLMHGDPEGIRADLVYYPQINTYKGWRNIQLRIVDFR